jgi:single-strand DNA-binding protein
MSSVNKAILMGRLGRDPELRHTGTGKPVANFSIATDSVWKDKEGTRQKQTEWHKITAWGSLAELCTKYLAKGRDVYVEGEIRTRQYDDKDGIKRSVTEIIASEVKFIGGPRAGAGDVGAEAESADSDEIPF